MNSRTYFRHNAGGLLFLGDRGCVHTRSCLPLRRLLCPRATIMLFSAGMFVLRPPFRINHKLLQLLAIIDAV